MKPIVPIAIIFGPISAAVPAQASVMIAATADEVSVTQFDVTMPGSGWAVGAVDTSSTDSPVDAIGATLTNYASMLPVPSDWLLLVTGFSVVGYAMRSRKQARISFN